MSINKLQLSTSQKLKFIKWSYKLYMINLVNISKLYKCVYKYKEEEKKIKFKEYCISGNFRNDLILAFSQSLLNRK